MSGPEIIEGSSRLLHVEEWEAFATMLQRTHAGKSAPDPAVVVTVRGRYNRTTTEDVVTLLLSPADAARFVADVAHSARFAGSAKP